MSLPAVYELRNTGNKQVQRLEYLVLSVCPLASGALQAEEQRARNGQALTALALAIDTEKRTFPEASRVVSSD